MGRFSAILLILLFLKSLAPVYADDKTANLLVLFPKLNAAYDRVFSEIVSGIDSHKYVKSSTFLLTSSSSQKDIQKQIDRKQIDAIVALGQSSYDIANLFSDQLPVIHGGMIMSPNGHSGISLAGSPSEFFAHLKSIAPPVKRVFTVYSEENSGWLIDIAKQEAKRHDIELHAYPVTDVRHAVNQFSNVLERTKDSSDAIWLLLDKLVPDQTVLPLALEAAWKKHIVLFSNNPSHSKRGALFSLFPDHEKLGYNLAELCIHQLDSNLPTVLPLSNLKISVNERTASHLGLRYSGEQRDTFDIIYPHR